MRVHAIEGAAIALPAIEIKPVTPRNSRHTQDNQR